MNSYCDPRKLFLVVGCFLCLLATVNGQLTIKSRKSFTGSIVKIDRHLITIDTANGEKQVAFNRSDETTVPLTKAGVNLRHKTVISLSGKIPANQLAVGQIVRLKTELNRSGKTRGEVELIQSVIGKSRLEVVPSTQPENSRAYVPSDVIGQVESLRRQMLVLQLPREPFSPSGKLRIRLTKNAQVEVKENGLDRASAGDVVSAVNAIELDSGDLVAESISIVLKEKTGSVGVSKKRSADPFDSRNYLAFSNEPTKPRDLRSRHFLLHTDLSERSAKQLLDKLEYMIALVSRYYGKLPSDVIECFVVRDLEQWQKIPLEPGGVMKIREGAGVTISRSLGKRVKSIVYACDDHGVVQHEAIHAYCSQTFGGTGPTWYSEGMAEMGQYWKKGNLAVQIPPPVIKYLTSAPPKKLADIVAAGQITGDSWQAYAWRWALCHLLASNTNYSKRFKQLGLNMMGGGGASFQSVYGDVAPEISFEYDQFVQSFGNGYRVDLCQWDWGSKPIAISGKKRLKCEVLAKRGWQSTRLQVHKGKRYEFVAQGEWKISEKSSVDPGGDSVGNGKLIGVVYSDYKLGTVLELGAKGVFVAESDGHLFVRCQEKMTELSDNEGTITVHFRRAPQ